MLIEQTVPSKQMNTILTVLALCLTSISGAIAANKQFLMTHNPDDARFLTSIEKVGSCQIPSDPVSQVHVPSETYPKESVDLDETGTVQVELSFDDLWCVRKATIVKPSGYWRLDQASSSFIITVIQAGH